MIWMFGAVVSAAASAATSVGQKTTLKRIDSSRLPLVMSFFVLVASLWIPLVVSVSASPKALSLVLAKSVLDATGFWLMMRVLEVGELGATLPLLAVSPGITAVVAHFALGEALAGTQWTGIALMIVGSYLLEARPGQTWTGPFQSLVRSSHAPYLGAALVNYALAAVLGKFLVSKELTPLALVFQQNVCFFALFVLVAVLRGSVQARSALQGTGSAWPLLLLLGALTIVHRTSQLWAAQYVPVALVVAVKRSSTVLATLAGWKWLGEPNVAVRAGSAALIVSGGLVVAWAAIVK